MNFVVVVLVLIALVILAFFYIPKKEPFGNLTVATEIDHKRAVKYALERSCLDNGYKWIQYGDEFAYDCKHVKETCERDSIYPTAENSNPRYYEWRSPDTEDAKIVAARTISSKNLQSENELLSKQYGHSDYRASESEIAKDGVCIIGNEMYREFCESNDLIYDKTNGKCKTSEKYCRTKCLAFCHGDCYQSPTDKGLNYVLGNTLARSMSCGAFAAVNPFGQMVAASNAAAIAVCKIDEAVKK